jgi:hypothetical protein
MDMDLRRYKRLGWNRAGMLSAETGKVLAHCFVKNISPNGARLMVARPAAVPDQFKLQVRGAKLQPNCMVRWRRGKEIGVQFFP